MVGENLLHSLTGTAAKAALLIKRQTVKPEMAGKTIMPSVKNSSLLSSAMNGLQEATGKLNAAKNMLSGLTGGILDSQGDYFTLQVQYNPSSLQMNSQKGEYISKNGCGQLIDQISLKPQTTLDVTLIFDDMNIADAFDMGLNLSVASLKDLAVHAADAADGGESVQRNVEMLTGIIADDANKHVMFVWADMAFGGILANIDSKYTMFNRKGSPIRAEVTLHIIQNNKEEMIKGGDGIMASQSSYINYWRRSYEDLFKLNKDGGGVVNDAVSNIQKMNNLINF